MLTKLIYSRFIHLICNIKRVTNICQKIVIIASIKTEEKITMRLSTLLNSQQFINNPVELTASFND